MPFIVSMFLEEGNYSFILQLLIRNLKFIQIGSVAPTLFQKRNLMD
jgi:hypothetical protein